MQKRALYLQIRRSAVSRLLFLSTTPRLAAVRVRTPLRVPMSYLFDAHWRGISLRSHSHQVKTCSRVKAFESDQSHNALCQNKKQAYAVHIIENLALWVPLHPAQDYCACFLFIFFSSSGACRKAVQCRRTLDYRPYGQSCVAE